MNEPLKELHTGMRMFIVLDRGWAQSVDDFNKQFEILYIDVSLGELE